MMNKYKLIEDIDREIKKNKKNKDSCTKCIKAGCMNCCKNKENNYDDYSSSSDEYNIKKLYNFGGSERYSYRKKKYNMVSKKPRQQYNNVWMEHVNTVRSMYPDLPYKECLKLASKTY